MYGTFVESPSPRVSERMYQKLMTQLAPTADGEAHMWNYYKLWPNVALEIYPDQIDFMQFVPVSATETVLREIAYALPRPQRDARRALYKLEHQPPSEPRGQELIERVQEGRVLELHRRPSAKARCYEKLRPSQRALFGCRQWEPPAKGWSTKRVNRPQWRATPNRATNASASDRARASSRDAIDSLSVTARRPRRRKPAEGGVPRPDTPLPEQRHRLRSYRTVQPPPTASLRGGASADGPARAAWLVKRFHGQYRPQVLTAWVGSGTPASLPEMRGFTTRKASHGDLLGTLLRISQGIREPALETRLAQSG